MNRADYPPDWETISIYVRFFRAGGRCEGSPHYPHCRAVHGLPHPVTGSIVILTTAHLDHDKTNSDWGNLRALCQRCHLDHDREQHTLKAALTRRRRQLEAGQMEMML